jgi:4-coumarate--CoA ligase
VVFCTVKVLENLLKLKDEDYFPARIILYDSEASADLENFDEFVEAGSFDHRFSPTEVDPQEDVALLLTSSGTSGVPKLIQLTHANFRITMVHAGEPNWFDFTEEETVMAYVPFFRILGTGTGLGAILYGAKLVILEKFVPDRFLNLIQEHKITKLFAVPTNLLFLVKSPLGQKYDLSSVKDVFCGSIPLTRDLEEEVKTLLRIKSVQQMYGLTEISGLATATPKNVKRTGSTGQVVTAQQIKVCDPESGKVLGANECGELRIKGAGVMKGYLGNDHLTVFDEEGYLKSGDLGYFDEEGFFYITYRLQDMIKYKGFQVSISKRKRVRQIFYYGFRFHQLSWKLF